MLKCDLLLSFLTYFIFSPFFSPVYGGCVLKTTSFSEILNSDGSINDIQIKILAAVKMATSDWNKQYGQLIFLRNAWWRQDVDVCPGGGCGRSRTSSDQHDVRRQIHEPPVVGELVGLAVAPAIDGVVGNLRFGFPEPVARPRASESYTHWSRTPFWRGALSLSGMTSIRHLSRGGYLNRFRSWSRVGGAVPGSIRALLRWPCPRPCYCFVGLPHDRRLWRGRGGRGCSLGGWRSLLSCGSLGIPI